MRTASEDAVLGYDDEHDVNNILWGVGSGHQLSQLLLIFYYVEQIVDQIFDCVGYAFNLLFFGVDLSVSYSSVYGEQIEE